MKNLVFCSVLAMAILTPNVSASDRVTIKMGEISKDIRVDNLKETSVCNFKKQVAKMLDMKVREFDLNKNGRKLDEDKTLDGAGVQPYNKVEAKPVSVSYQCR